MSAVFWFTKDLRLQDNPALNLAVRSAGTTAPDGTAAKVAAVYVVNSTEYAGLEGIRQHSLTESLRALDESLGGRLNVFSVTAAEETANALAIAATNLGASKVIATRLFDPAGKKLQNTVGHALAARGIHLILEGSAYAVAPGTVRKPDETPYRVYTPFYKAWMQVGLGEPAGLPSVKVEWRWIAEGTGIPEPTKPCLLYTSPSPRDYAASRMPSSA